MVDFVEVKSSNIEKLGFDESKQELHVVFKTSPKYVYIYEEVPASMDAKLMASDSKGGFLYEYFVKTKWKFRKERL